MPGAPRQPLFVGVPVTKEPQVLPEVPAARGSLAMDKPAKLTRGLCCCWALLAACCWAEPACLPLSSSVKSKIAAYVALKYELAPDLSIEDEGLVDATCFRRIAAHAAEPRRLVGLFLSPDQLFLSESLLDMRVDPGIERQRVSDETQAALLSDASPSLGSERASVTIVEVADFQCPYCKRFADVLAGVPAEELKDVRIVFKQRPLTMHHWARAAALSAICASYQGSAAFWALHDFLSASQSSISADTLEARVAELAKGSGRIDIRQLQDCLSQHKADDALARDEELAEKYHVDATPTVFVNGVRKVGFRTSDELLGAIRSARAARAALDKSNLGAGAR